MLSKCAHPTCFAQFRYLRQGRIFKVHLPAVAMHKVEHFWLCDQCSRAFTIVMENGKVRTHPIYLQLKSGNADAGSEPYNPRVAA